MTPCRSGTVLRCDGSRTTLTIDGNIARDWADPLEALQWMGGESFAEHAPRPMRWAGFVSYDCGRLFETIPTRAVDDLSTPLFAFGLFIESSADAAAPLAKTSKATQRSTFSREAYLAAAQRCIDYIAAGDVFQVNLSQRFTTGLRVQPSNIFQRLTDTAPSWYGALLEFDDFSLISNSPELFLRVTPDRKIVTRPIKGTRPMRSGMEAELRDSAKDQAELNMIVDLERNDLGRVCELGSIRVTEPRVIERHPTVFHGAATVEGRLREEVSFVDLLRATFPGGSITGAPKIRAMEIIEELEPVRRGPYCGAIGYVAAGGELMFNLAIRTMIARDGLVHIPVGGGIVADSNPLAEYEETLVKARAMFAALGITAAG